jgi:hypothetical protein
VERAALKLACRPQTPDKGAARSVRTASSLITADEVLDGEVTSISPAALIHTGPNREIRVQDQAARPMSAQPRSGRLEPYHATS